MGKGKKNLLYQSVILFMFCFISISTTTYAQEEIKSVELNQIFEKTEYEGDMYVSFVVTEYGKLYTDGTNRLTICKGSNKDEIGDIYTQSSVRVAPGEYYAKVSLKGSYIIKFMAEDTSYEREENNSFDKANIIEINKPYYGNLNQGSFSINDYDYYKFYLSDPKSLSITFDKQEKWREYKIKLFSEDAYLNTTEVFTIKGTQLSNTSNKVRVPAGYYYVEISQIQTASANYGNPDYRFSVITEEIKDSLSEYEYNDSEQTANTIEINKDYTGNISNSSDVDYFRLNISSTGKGRLKLQTPRQSKDRLFKAELLKLDNRGVVTRKDSIYSSTNPVVLGQEVVLDQGVYYIRLENGSGILDAAVNYTIGLEFKEITSSTKVQRINLSTIEKQYYNIGDTTTIQTSIFPSEASNTRLFWESSNTKTATVDQNGTVYCRGTGITSIRATAQDGSGVTSSIQIQVVANKRIEIINKSSDSLYVGDQIKLAAAITPNPIGFVQLNWTSSNTNVATIDQYGIVICKNPGTTYIKVVTQDGSNLTAEYRLQVKSKDILRINIVNEGSDDLYVGDTTDLVVYTEPDQYDDLEIVWRSDDESVAIVDEDGVVDCLSEGRALIYATILNDTTIHATYEIVVRDETSDDNNLRKIRITKGKIVAVGRNSYQVTLSSNQRTTQITPVLSDRRATLYINNRKMNQITVSVASRKSKAVKIKVVAENGDIQTYRIKVKRR